MLDPNTDTLTRATHLMRSAWECTLLYDQSPFETRCMIDPRTGGFLIAVVKDAFEADDVVLACPRDSFDTKVRVSVELSEIVTEEQSDRFTAYHLPATAPLLALGTLSYAKLDSGEVITQDQCPLANPLISVMGPLCRTLNAHRSNLSSLCTMMTGIAHDSPLAVGVDDTGIDIRVRHGLVRLKLAEPIDHPDHALDSINTLLDSIDMDAGHA